MSCPGMAARRTWWRHVLFRCGLVAGATGLIVAVLLVVSWRSGSLVRTVQSPVMARALADVRRAAQDEAQVAWVREMDRLARHAYFSSRRFQQRGVILLVATLLVSLGCLTGAARLGRALQDPRQFRPAEEGRAKRRVWYMVSVGCVVAIIAMGLWWQLPAKYTDTPAERAIAVPAPVTMPVAVQPSPVSDDLLEQGWTQFRGPHGLGVAAATNAPIAWNLDTGEGVRWRVPLEQPGFSSPIIWAGKIFLTTADGQERAVLAFDAETGRQAWRRVVAYGGGKTPLPEVTDDTGYAAPTMACDGVRVFALFGTGDLAAFSLDGVPVWQQHLGAASIDYGHASSLLYAGGNLIVQGDRREDGVVKALDPMTGDIRWAVAREVGPSWSSPVAIPVPEVRLLLHAEHATSLHRLSDGGELWSFDAVGGEIAPSPAWDAGRVFVAQEYGRLVAFPSETNTPVALWEYNDHLPNVASPVARDGRVWVAAQSGGAACLDGATGALLWEHFFDEGFYASPVISGRHLYLVDRAGTVQILETGTNFTIVATHVLGEACDATPAVGEGILIFRTAGHLICVGTAD